MKRTARQAPDTPESNLIPRQPTPTPQPVHSMYPACHEGQLDAVLRKLIRQANELSPAMKACLPRQTPTRLPHFHAELNC